MNKLLPFAGFQILAGILILLNAVVPPAPLSPDLYFNPPYVTAFLALIFLVPAGLAVGYMSTRAFKSSGLFGLLLMGTGAAMVYLAPLSLFAGVTNTSIAFYFTVNNLFGIQSASIVFFVGTVLTHWGTTISSQHRLKVLIGTFSSVGLAATAVVAGASGGWIPPFYSSVSETVLSQFVLTTSAVFLGASAVILGWIYLGSRSEIVYWYMVAMLLFMIGVVSGVLIRHPGDLMSWLTRVCEILSAGAIYVAVPKALVPHQETKDWGSRTSDQPLM
jgi:hypothetical protein